MKMEENLSWNWQLGLQFQNLRVLEQVTKPNMAQNKPHRMMLMGTKLKKEKA